MLVCASAIEIALKAADIRAKTDRLHDLTVRAREISKNIKDFDDKFLKNFRVTRNRIVHDGFSNQDNGDTASLYIEVGLPFLCLCYSEFHSFDLMDGLLPEYVEQIHAAQKVHSLAKGLPNLDVSYCLHSFGHLVRWCCKHNFSAGWEIDALVHAEEIGHKFEKAYAEKEKLERLFNVSWRFDCPVCEDLQSVVSELDTMKLDEREVIPTRMACTNCGFVVSQFHPFLSQVLLERQVVKYKPQILKGYGIR